MTEQTTPAPTSSEPLQLRCLEVFGGNRAERQELSVPGMDVLVYAHPFKDSHSGGDLHYVSTCLRGNISRFLVADVSGHGDSVGELALTLRKLLRKNINTPDQTRLTRQLNAEFSNLSSGGKFATAIIGTYLGPTHSLLISNAGHPPPLRYSAQEKAWDLLTSDDAMDKHDVPGALANLPLGIIEPTEYCQFAVQLGIDDLVVFYTDSLIEASDPKGRQLGPEGLVELVSSLGPCEEPRVLCDALLDRLNDYRGGIEADDDVTMLVMRHNAGKAPGKSIGEWANALGRLVTGQ